MKKINIMELYFRILTVKAKLNSYYFDNDINNIPVYEKRLLNLEKLMCHTGQFVTLRTELKNPEKYYALAK
nr:hypothetical protein [uncultured Carboxylicivirga sp.]